MALQELGVPFDEANRAVRLFGDYDEQALLRTHAFHEDEGRVIQTAQAAAAEPTGLLEADRRQRGDTGTAPASASP